jgi:hypothetical protein
MARKALFNIEEADTGRPAFRPPASANPSPAAAAASIPAPCAPRRQEYREGKRAVMFFLPEEAFAEMHVLLARQGRRKVQHLMEELVDDWFRRENAPRLLK